ncbi:unnamed protein product [Ilex paraguariensis]|uniref:STM1-like N-terminal domain-containing protein n=1 Tax=Ilex paraguariensis TaxID=185542 RepID=A0ABC8QLR5_9AQUA
MATTNPFDLLGDDDAEDPSQLIAAQQQKIVPKRAPPPVQPAQQPPSRPASKLPSKPLPPAQAVEHVRKFLEDSNLLGISCDVLVKGPNTDELDIVICWPSWSKENIVLLVELDYGYNK